MPTCRDGGQPDDGAALRPNRLDHRTFMTYGADSDTKPVSLKTVQITNHSDRTMYPIMHNPNSNVLNDGSKTGLYDPYDPTRKEFRGLYRPRLLRGRLRSDVHSLHCRA